LKVQSDRSGRVKVDEVNGFVRKVLAEDLEIVAVIELAHSP
jgi:hypothetical protein